MTYPAASIHDLEVSMDVPGTIWCERGGVDGPLLVLLHGLGGNGTVWNGLKPFLEKHWHGRWIIPDFRGHGRSLHRAPYGFGIHASDVASLLGQDEDVTLIGHSMGGIVAFALATGIFGVQIERVFAFGVKVDWTDAEIAKANTTSRMSPKLFDSKAEAIERYLKVSGLLGLVSPDSDEADVGIRTQQGKFRLAADPLTYALGTLDCTQIAQAVRSPIHLLCGELDPMARPESMKRLGAEVKILPGLGHNPHVEAPGVLWQAISEGWKS